MPWNGKCPLFLILDLVEDIIWGVRLGCRPPGRAIWGSVLPFRPPRASNLGVRFTLPTTPSIKFGGHFRLSGSSEVKFGGHSCIIDLSDTQIWAHSSITDLSDTLIWGSFLLHRPTRHPNLGVKLPVPHKLHTPLLPKPTSQSESPHLFFAVPRGDHRGSSTKRSRGQGGDAKGCGNLAPLPRLLFTFKLRSLP